MPLGKVSPGNMQNTVYFKLNPKSTAEYSYSMFYLLGWLLGLVYIGPAFLSPPELLLYFGITLFVLYGKLRSLTE